MSMYFMRLFQPILSLYFQRDKQPSDHTRGPIARMPEVSSSPCLALDFFSCLLGTVWQVHDVGSPQMRLFGDECLHYATSRDAGFGQSCSHFDIGASKYYSYYAAFFLNSRKLKDPR